MSCKQFLFITVISLAWLPLAYSFCARPGENPTWVAAPIVEQVTGTSVNVSWEGLLKQKECADNVIVKHFKKEDTADYKLSVGLDVSTTSYMILDLMPNEAYTYQVIAREDKGILGVDH